jgi:hypothetical protein
MTALAVTGQVEEAVRELRLLVKDQADVLGVGDPTTLATRANLASALGEIGRTDEAIVEFALLVRDQIRILGLNHSTTLTTRANLSLALGETDSLDNVVDLRGTVRGDAGYPISFDVTALVARLLDAAPVFARLTPVQAEGIVMELRNLAALEERDVQFAIEQLLTGGRELGESVLRLVEREVRLRLGSVLTDLRDMEAQLAALVASSAGSLSAGAELNVSRSYSAAKKAVKKSSKQRTATKKKVAKEAATTRTTAQRKATKTATRKAAAKKTATRKTAVKKTATSTAKIARRKGAILT